MDFKEKMKFKRTYRIAVKKRCFVWDEYIDADNLPDAISECTRRILKEDPDAKSWETRLRWERDNDGNTLRKGKGF